MNRVFATQTRWSPAMVRACVIISVKPRFAQMILDGHKTVELRRVGPNVSPGDLVLLYVSSPVKALKAVAIVGQIIRGRPDAIWREVSLEAGVSLTEFRQYYDGTDRGCAIRFSLVHEVSTALDLERLRRLWPGFRPPQNFQYATAEQFVALVDAIASTDGEDIGTVLQRSSQDDTYSGSWPSRRIA